MRGNHLVAVEFGSLCGSALRRAATHCLHQLLNGKSVILWRSTPARQVMHGSGITFGFKYVSLPPASISLSATVFASFTPCSWTMGASWSRSHPSSARVAPKDCCGLIGLTSGAHNPQIFNDRAWQNLGSCWLHWWIR